MADPIRRAAATSAEEVAVVCGHDRLTYAQVRGRCRRLVGHLRGLGLQRGDRVAIVAANCHRYLEVYQAVPAAGFVVVPLNSRHTVAELRYAAVDAGARVLITDRPADELDGCFERVIRLPEDYEAALAAATEAPLGEGVTEDDLAGLFYTGGTTGAAKGVMLSHRNLIANAFTTFTWAHLRAEDRWLVMSPLFHAAGSIAVLASTWMGGRMVVLSGFDAGAALDLIETEGVTATLAVPTMLSALADEQAARPRDVASLRLLSHGASPAATDILRRTQRAFPHAELVHLYGATETSPVATTLPHEELLLDRPQARSCGQPAVGVQIRVVGPTGEELTRREVGEVAIRGANVMAGYWNKPTETAAALQDGWYHSGDLGYLDEASFLYLVDRAKDMIISGGENVYSTEVEEALHAHDAVLEAAVFGIPHPEWGEVVHAVVVTRYEIEPAELVAHCRVLIAGYKVPKQIDISVEPLPKSGAGKILKRELREPFWADRDTRIGQ